MSLVAYLIGEAAEPLAVDLGYANVPFLVATTLERAVAEAAARRSRGDRAALAGVRELRPVQGFRAPRRGVQEAGREPQG